MGYPAPPARRGLLLEHSQIFGCHYSEDMDRQHPGRRLEEGVVENYASTQEKRRFKRESFDDFIAKLMDEVTLVSISIFVCVFLYLFYIFNFFLCLCIFRIMRDQRNGVDSSKLESEGREDRCHK